MLPKTIFHTLPAPKEIISETDPTRKLKQKYKKTKMNLSEGFGDFKHKECKSAVIILLHSNVSLTKDSGRFGEE